MENDVRPYVVTRGGIRLFSGSNEKTGFDRAPLHNRRLFKKLKSVVDRSKLWNVPDLKQAFWYAATVKSETSERVLQEVRLLSSYLVKGFIPRWTSGSPFEILKRMDISLNIKSREVKIRDKIGAIEYIDDYYWTATRAYLMPVLDKLGLSFPLINHRDNRSLDLLLPSTGHKSLVSLIVSGDYVGSKCERFYGSRNIANARDICLMTALRFNVGCRYSKVAGRKRVSGASVIRSTDESFVDTLLHPKIGFDLGKELFPYQNLIDRETFKELKNAYLTYKTQHEPNSYGDTRARVLSLFKAFDRKHVFGFLARGGDVYVRYHGDLMYRAQVEDD